MLEISWIKLHIEGQLDGTAYVVPQMAETQKVSGAVNLEWGGDVSATKYILEYLPGDVKGGTLTIKYVLN